VGRSISIAAVNRAAASGSEIFIAPQRNAVIEAPKATDILSVGVIARIKQIVKTPQNSILKVSVEALSRAKITGYVEEKGYFAVTVAESPYILPDTEIEKEAYLRVAKQCFFEFSVTDKRVPKEMVTALNEINDVNEFIDKALSVVNLSE
jgi:ATP-dependent Lon protease